MKRCSTCKEEKPVTEFTKWKKSKDGLYCSCRKCKNDLKRVNWRKNGSKNYTNNTSPEKKKEYMETFKKKNPGYFSKRAIKWAKENPEKRKEIKRRSGKKQAQKRIKNGTNKMYCQRRAARKKALVNDLTMEQWLNSLEYFDSSCAYCGSKESNLQQEHIIPLSKNGGYTASNIIPACQPCNTSKYNRDMEQWYRSQPYFSKKSLDKINKWIHSHAQNLMKA